MGYVAVTDPQTLEDQRRYTRARMTEVSCGDCLARVEVKKNSAHHVSIQWNRDALLQCATFASMAGGDEGRSLSASCPRLSESIDAAVRDGQLAVGAEDGY